MDETQQEGQGFDNWLLVHIITKLEVGGAQFATLDTINHFSHNFGKCLLLSGPGGTLDKNIKDLCQAENRFVDSLGRAVNPFKDAKAFIEITNILKRYKKAHPEKKILVHTHCSKAGVIGRSAAACAGADAIVHTVHGYGYHRHPKWWLRPIFKAAERICAEFTHGFTVDSHANMLQGKKDDLFTNSPVEIIYCGVPFDKFHRQTEARTSNFLDELDIPARHKIVIHLTNFKEQKNPRLFMHVAQNILRKNSDLTFLVSGDGPLRDECVEFSKVNGFAANMRFLGWRNDVPKLLQHSHLLLNTSSWEGLPQAFPQALLSGVPIVASDVDGAKEIIIPKTNGSLCPPSDTELFVKESLFWLADNAPSIDAAKEDIQHFSSQYTTSQLGQFYNEIIKKRQRY